MNRPMEIRRPAAAVGAESNEHVHTGALPTNQPTQSRLGHGRRCFCCEIRNSRLSGRRSRVRLIDSDLKFRPITYSLRRTQQIPSKLIYAVKSFYAVFAARRNIRPNPRLPLSSPCGASCGSARGSPGGRPPAFATLNYRPGGHRPPSNPQEGNVSSTLDSGLGRPGGSTTIWR